MVVFKEEYLLTTINRMKPTFFWLEIKIKKGFQERWVCKSNPDEGDTYESIKKWDESNMNKKVVVQETCM